MARLDSSLESAGAEFLVLGHLLIEGIQAFKAYTNFPGYDFLEWKKPRSSWRYYTLFTVTCSHLDNCTKVPYTLTRDVFCRGM